MTVEIEISEYNSKTGFKYKWENGFKIITELDNHEFVIKANKEGLLSLALNLLALSQSEVPINYHLHLDDLNSLEVGSYPLIIEKI